MPKTAIQNQWTQEEIEEVARSAVYDAGEEAIATLDLRRAAVARFKKLYAKHEQVEAVIEAIERLTRQEVVSDNLSALAGAWVAMDITDETPGGGVGQLLADFVDLYNSPSNVDVVDGISAKNVALILQTADRVRAYLSSGGSEPVPTMH